MNSQSIWNKYWNSTDNKNISWIYILFQYTFRYVVLHHNKWMWVVNLSILRNVLEWWLYKFGKGTQTRCQDLTFPKKKKKINWIFYIIIKSIELISNKPPNEWINVYIHCVHKLNLWVTIFSHRNLRSISKRVCFFSA